MNTIPYTILRKEGNTFDGSGVQYDIGVAAKAKYSPENPREVAHELLAVRLGIVLGLPIPVGVPLRDESDGGRLLWSSLAVTREQLPKASIADIEAILDDERMACGIIVFDSWILNKDRWEKNISFFDGKTYIFDHGRAFGAGQRALLEKNRNSIGIDYHCLCDIPSLDSFDEWHGRILAVPETYLRESIALAVETGIPAHDAGHLCEYMLDRRFRLREIFRDGYSRYFHKLNKGLFNPFMEDVSQYCI